MPNEKEKWYDPFNGDLSWCESESDYKVELWKQQQRKKALEELLQQLEDKRRAALRRLPNSS